MKRWSQEEIEKIKRVYPASSRSEVEAQFPDRSWRSIRWKANQKLGLKLGYRLDSYWREDELRFLRDNYGNMMDAEIGNKIGRSAGSVQSKRRDLGLEKRHIEDITQPSQELSLSEAINNTPMSERQWK